MAEFTFKFYGSPVEIPSETNLQLRSIQPDLIITEYRAITVRSAESKPEIITVSEDTIVALEMSNDVEWHYNKEEFEEFLEKQPGTRSADNIPEVPGFFSSTTNTRGFEDIIVTKALKVITGLAAKHTAELLVEKMEAKLEIGLHRLDDNFKFIKFDKANIENSKPYLLFIHGTNSNTSGAFSGLKKNKAFDKLYKFYEGRVLAFEHKTLSESPLKNATDLLTALPDQITLDIVSHSRGGLIADLLARCSKSGLPFDDAELKIINANMDFLPLKKEVEAANHAATNKNITVPKIVRVAAPSAGTVLIDSRLDNLVNVFCNLIKLIPGAAACMPLGLFLDFARAVVRERTDINVFPGVAAQIPGSPLIRLLNNPNREIESQLFVISGDVEASGIVKTLQVMSTNLYFGEAHDLVVNSNSMFKGTYRKTNVLEHFEQDPAVNHFNYFINTSSQDALIEALTEPSKIGSSYQSLGISKTISVFHERGITGKKPLVYIIPGITNTELESTITDEVGNTRNERLWINFLGIATGAISKLKAGKAGIKPTAVQQQVYGELMNYLNTDFDVKPFPYDWRLDLADAGNKLAEDIQQVLDSNERTNKEFHFITHSMGGLVLRAMISLHNDLWKTITVNKKTKVLMLGVPNDGSYSIIRLLLGKDAVIKKLALLDFVHSKTELLEIFKNFTGLLQLLPKNDSRIFGEALWKEMVSANNNAGAVPSAEQLKMAEDFFNIIKDTEFDNEIFRYVAGQADDTPIGYTIDKMENRISFIGSAEGDGRVLWSTIPDALKSENVYYVNTDHGSIPQYEQGFEGFRDLLLRGKTDAPALSKQRPVNRSPMGPKQMPDSDYVTIPSEFEFTNHLLSNTEPVRKSVPKDPIGVSVMNGDLVHSKYPVVVGHFKGDGIVNAEKYLDQALGFRLSEYHFMNNYPGEIGTHLVILDDNKEKKGTMTCEGVVVGLGEFGALTEGRLLVSLTQAFLTLAIRFNELLKNKQNDPNDVVEFGISALTVGSDFAGLRITTSVKTIFLAVLQANEKLDTMSRRESAKFNYKKINHIEVVEIYQHKSVQVGRIIGDLLVQDGFNNFRFVPPEIRLGSGALSRIANENVMENWHRLEVTVTDKNDFTNTNKNDDDDTEKNRKSPAGNTLPIRFTALTDKAHADENLLPANRLIVDTLMERLSKHSKWDKAFSQTLYELLIPNNFKGFGSSLHNLVLIVDKHTARYPWELLHDANGISDKPMVINTGIVRQLKSGEQRENIIINSSNRALVIGNPFTDGRYPSLPAAEMEAKAVQQILLDNGLETTPSIAEQDIYIIQKLLTRSYKIIHIASHGIVGKTAEEATGVIFGKEIIFTAGDFDQIRVVPEFVFINCCSSDKYDPAIAEQMQQKYRLAASVGTQLIQMGVKAAIVTGWEIDDSAAKTFSSCFYKYMFEGYNFGDSVREARSKTYSKHPLTNTWGAYQCYGDPFYAFKNSSSIRKLKYNFVSPIEVIAEMDNLIGEMTSGLKRKEKKEWQKKIEDIIDGLYFSWRQNATIMEKIASAYRTIGFYQDAIKYYEQIFDLENAVYTVKSLEQYYNVKIRFAIDQWKNKKINSEDASKIFDNAIEGLKKLNGNTLERYSLIAASYRRFSEISNDDIAHLIEAARYYHLAYQHGLKTTGYIESYPYFNWLHFAILLDGYGDGDDFLKIPGKREELDKKALDYAKKSDLQEPNFSKKTAGSSHYIALLLLASNAEEIDKFSTLIINNFEGAWKKEGDENSRDSFTSYLSSIVGLIRKLNPKEMLLKEEKMESLEAVKRKIETQSHTG
ncbi:DUF7379 domain-containing protein [Flavitalea sp.]|nr:CHAT domain-containing protein [Flavitalea sp.]